MNGDDPEGASDDLDVPLDDRDPAIAVRVALSLAWRNRWRLVAVLVPVLVPVLFVETLVEVVFAQGGMAIVNGALVSSGLPAPVSWFLLVLVVASWCVAVAAAVVVVAGAYVGVNVSARGALAMGLRRALRVIVLVATTLVAAFFAASLAISAGIGASPLLLIGGAIAVALVLCRFVVAIVSEVLEPGEPATTRAANVLRGRSIRMTVTVVIGAGAIPWVVSWLLTWLGDAIENEIAGMANVAVLFGGVRTLVADVGVIALVGAQTAVITVVYLQQRSANKAELTQEQAADLAAIASLVRALPAASGKRGRVLAGTVTAPTVIVSAVAAWNPYEAPVVADREIGDFPPREVAWSDHTSPVLLDGTWVNDCLDERCHRSELRTGERQYLAGENATVLRDGTVLDATNTQTGVLLERCPRIGDCASTRVPWPGLSGGPVYLALGAGVNEEIWIAAALERGDNSSTELSVMRCVDWTCAEASITSLGTIDTSLSADVNRFHQYGWYQVSVLDVTVSDDRALVAARGANATWLAECDPVTCSDPRSVRYSTSNPMAEPVGGVDDGLAIVDLDGLTYRLLPPDTMSADGPAVDVDGRPLGPASVDVDGGEFFAVVAELVDRPGFSVTIGDSEPQTRRLVLIHCSDAACFDLERIPLGFTDEAQRAALAVKGQQVLVFHGTRVSAFDLPL